MPYSDFESELQSLPKEIQEFYQNKLSTEGASWLALRIDEIVSEYNKENNKTDADKIRERKIKAMENLREDSVKTIHDFIRERGLTQDDVGFKLEIEIKNQELESEILHGVYPELVERIHNDSENGQNAEKNKENDRKRNRSTNPLKVDRSEPYNLEKFIEEGKNFLKAVYNKLSTKLLKIDRSQPFDPDWFPGPDNTIRHNWWTIDEAQDENSLALTEIDLDQIELVTMLNNGETTIQGEERLNRLKTSNYIRLDATISETLLNNQSLIPEKWKDARCIFFDGTILRNPYGERFVVYLVWSGIHWRRDSCWLGDPWVYNFCSAVLAPQNAGRARA